MPKDILQVGPLQRGWIKCWLLVLCERAAEHDFVVPDLAPFQVSDFGAPASGEKQELAQPTGRATGRFRRSPHHANFGVVKVAVALGIFARSLDLDRRAFGNVVTVGRPLEKRPDPFPGRHLRGRPTVGGGVNDPLHIMPGHRLDRLGADGVNDPGQFGVHVGGGRRLPIRGHCFLVQGHVCGHGRVVIVFPLPVLN
jgi:hypothetical protein